MLKHSFSGLIMSLVELLVGIMLLIDPAGLTSGIIIAVGVVMMGMGLRSIIRYFRTDPEEAAVRQLLVKGFVTFLAGAFCAFQSNWFIVTFPVLTLLYGVMVLITGLTKLQWMVDIIRMKRSKWFWIGISAAISVLCGVVIITSPFSSTAVLWMFIGISLIVEAVLDVIGSIFGNREKRESAANTQEEV